eukprot:scaffold49693_cov32-Tisochrysis_lutea.AAC.2
MQPCNVVFTQGRCTVTRRAPPASRPKFLQACSIPFMVLLRLHAASTPHSAPSDRCSSRVSHALAMAAETSESEWCAKLGMLVAARNHHCLLRPSECPSLRPPPPPHLPHCPRFRPPRHIPLHRPRSRLPWAPRCPQTLRHIQPQRLQPRLASRRAPRQRQTYR